MISPGPFARHLKVSIDGDGNCGRYIVFIDDDDDDDVFVQFRRNHGAGTFHCACPVVADEGSGSCTRLAVVVVKKVGKKFS